MLSSLMLLPILLATVARAQQQQPVVVCVAGQCLQGFSNTTIGTKLTVPGLPSSIQLLPGQYTSSTNPQLLHQALTSSPPATLASSPGFNASSPALPLTVALQPGLAVYPQALYSGAASFASLPTTPSDNSSTPLSGGSLALSQNIWVSVASGSSHVVLWDSVPDISQLPSPLPTGSLSLLDFQSSSCSPACSGTSICSPSTGTCTCPAGFTGSSCESCAAGFFGKTCQPCPSGCACDEGIGGSGKCLRPLVKGSLETCNCLNGACASGGGGCTCNAGWTTADNGTACAKCTSGFFLNSGGDCKACAIGCTSCADSTASCLACAPGFTKDGDDPTQCKPIPVPSSTGQICPKGGFGDGAKCSPCSSTCGTCKGPSSNDCIECASGRLMDKASGQCVSVDGNGVCEGSGLIGDNIKQECDTCGSKCTACKIPNFTSLSTVDQLQCTSCLPGFVLAQGKCVESCPSGTFLGSDNLSCTPCDAACGTCAGSADFCLTCRATSQLASGGKCVTTCPPNSIAASATQGTCTPCHPDCATCSGGGAFNQCSSCPPEKPVLSSGRCLASCARGQFFDKTGGGCVACDASCSSCAGSGPGNCLACSSSTQVLKGGTCIAANCAGGSTSVIPGLGVCLSQLVQTPTGTGSAPLPSISGLNTPIVVRRPLEWWQILLMALGCAFIFLVVLMLWRRHARKKRAEQTRVFATAKLGNGWRSRLAQFSERIFGGGKRRRGGAAGMGTAVGLGAPSIMSGAGGMESEEYKLMKLRAEEEDRHHRELEKILGSYEHSSRAGTSYNASRRYSPPLESVYDSDRRSAVYTEPSMYSQVTGMPRRTPEPRMPVKKGGGESTSRYSVASVTTSTYVPPREIRRVTPPPIPTELEDEVVIGGNNSYDSNKAGLGAGLLSESNEHLRDLWLLAAPTTTTTPPQDSGSNNPFLRKNIMDMK